MSASETTDQLLDAAQLLTQERGYNAFSYKNLADQVGIRTASIHYHFPTKGDLGLALMERYQDGLERALKGIERKTEDPTARLKGFIKLYRQTETRGAICLCGSLASDRETLPEVLQEAVTNYLEHSEAWIADQIAAGVRTGDFDYAGKPRDAAATLLASLQGGLLLSRARSRKVIDTVQRVLMSTLTGE